MTSDDLSNIKWIALTAMATTLAAVFGAAVQSCVVAGYDMCQAFFFLHMARCLQIQEYTYEGDAVRQLSHTLDRLGLKSHRHAWIHSADVAGGSGIQVGYIRLRTHSVLLRMLSYLQLSHSAWIDDYGKRMRIRGYGPAIDHLVKVSQSAASRWDEREIEELREHFAMTSTVPEHENDCLSRIFFYNIDGCMHRAAGAHKTSNLCNIRFDVYIFLSVQTWFHQ